MRVNVTVPLAHVGPTLNDLVAGRRATIISMGSSGEEHQGRSAGETGDTTIVASVPLAALLGYSSELRSLTSGAGSFSMHPFAHRLVPTEEEARVLPNRMATL